MQIQYLKLLNFRNYNKLEINFSDKLNLIYGKNGMGKTNLVESIYVLALTKSFRTNNDKLLISKEQDLLKIEGIIKDKTKNNFKIILNNDGKKVKINNNRIPKLSDYISKFSVILFNPNDLQIIKDSPSVRRKNINMDLSQLDNQYLKYLSIYNKVLKQRNSYLKTIYINSNASREYLDILTNELIDLGEKIYLERKNFFDKINTYIDNYYEKITNNKNLYIKYYSDFEDFDRKKMLEKYKKYEKKDVIFGKTQIGIHRDDYSFMLNKEDLKDFGSEGQQKNAIISYKLSEIDIFYEQKRSYPILILDDLFSELDNEKIVNILNIINEKVQTFITTTEINKVSNEIIKTSKKIEIIDGDIKEDTK